MGKAWIHGAEVPLATGIEAAAKLIAGARLPLFTGLATDVAGIKAALRLAGRAGGVVDHEASGALYRNVEVLRSSGMFVGTPPEMRRRADRFLLVGGDCAILAPEFLAFLFGGKKDVGRAAADGGGRRILWLGAPEGAAIAAGDIPVRRIPCAEPDLTAALSMIRAALGARRFGAGPISKDAASQAATSLAAAGFACVLWSSAALDGVGIDMAAGLAADLNLTTRATCLPLGIKGQAWSAAQVATAASGYPLRIRFAEEGVEHDPFAYDGRRLRASGECDLVVWVSALDGHESPSIHGTSQAPLIAIRGADAPPPEAAVAFSVGLAGRDHAGALYRDEAGSFVAVDGSGDGASASAAGILDALAAALPVTRPAGDPKAGDPKAGDPKERAA